MSSTTVSVVIPAYNAAPFVERAVRSVLAQTYPVQEFVVVDDGSTDETLEVLQRLAESEPRLQVLSGPNRGGCAARNRGLAHVTAQYVQFLDADDWLEPDKIERDVETIGDRRPALLFGRHRGTDGYVAPPFPEGDGWAVFSRAGLGNTCSNLFRRDAVLAVGGWDESRPFNQEYDLITRMLMNEADVVCGSHIATVVDRQPGTISACFSPAMRDARLRIDARVRAFLRDEGRTAEAALLDAAMFLQVRQLFPLDPALAETLHDELFGCNYVPPATTANTWKYRLAYRWLGFRGAERIRFLPQRLRRMLSSPS